MEKEGGGCERGRRRDNSHLEGRKEEEGERYINIHQTPIYSPPSLSLSRKRKEGRKELLHRKGSRCCDRKEHKEGVQNNDYHVIPIII